ncbi:hypothetical protein [Nocardioides zeae]
MSGVIVERLRRDDLSNLLRRSDAPGIDVPVLERRAIELDERRRQLAEMFAEGGIDQGQLIAGTRRLDADLADVRETIAAAYTGTALAELAAASDAGEAWQTAPLDRQRLVLDALMTVTLLPSGRGRPAGWKPGDSYFRPETVRIDWRQ